MSKAIIIDENLHAKLKLNAYLQGKTIRQLCNEVLEKYLEDTQDGQINTIKIPKKEENKKEKEIHKKEASNIVAENNEISKEEESNEESNTVAKDSEIPKKKVEDNVNEVISENDDINMSKEELDAFLN